VAVNVVGIMCDILNEVRIFDEQVPIERKVSLGHVVVSSLVLLWLSVSDEEKVLLLILLHTNKEFLISRY